MTDRRFLRLATTSARLLAGTIVSVGAVLAVVTAITVPWPTVEREPEPVVAQPAPASTVLACDGALLALGRDLNDPGSLAAAAPQSVTSGVLPDAPPAVIQTMQAPVDGLGADAFTAPPEGDTRTDVAAAGSATASADDLAGFAAAACRPPLMESWLVAGSAATGAADFVVLSNPGVVNATVQLTVYGAEGPIVPPGGTDVVVAAGSQRAVPLAGIARGESSPIVRVTAVGAPVHASVQTSLTRVLEPLGVDQVGAVPGTDEVQRILGVVVEESDIESPTGAGTVLRALSPNSDAEVAVMVRATGGEPQLLEPMYVTLPAGVPTEIGLSGLGEGEYDVEVTSDTPIVAGVWQAAGFEDGADFAWFMPSPQITVPTLFAVPVGPSPLLTIANVSEQTADVEVRDRLGTIVGQVTLEPGVSTSLPVRASSVYELDSRGAAVLAAVTMSNVGQLAGYPLWPADAAAPSIRVYP